MTNVTSTRIDELIVEVFHLAPGAAAVGRDGGESQLHQFARRVEREVRCRVAGEFRAMAEPGPAGGHAHHAVLAAAADWIDALDLKEGRNE